MYELMNNLKPRYNHMQCWKIKYFFDKMNLKPWYNHMQCWKIK